MSPDIDAFAEHRLLILSELTRLNASVTGLTSEIRALDGTRQREIADLRVEIGMLKIKSGAWGVLGGAVPSAIAILYALARH